MFSTLLSDQAVTTYMFWFSMYGMYAICGRLNLRPRVGGLGRGHGILLLVSLLIRNLSLLHVGADRDRDLHRRIQPPVLLVLYIPTIHNGSQRTALGL